MIKENPIAGVENAFAELSISLEKACDILVKAREFDAKVGPVERGHGSNAADTGKRKILEDYEDATLLELRAAIDDLNDDELIDVIALGWLGRGDFSRAERVEARALAGERHRRHSADYLTGIPKLGDCLEEGLAQVGYSCGRF